MEGVVRHALTLWAHLCVAVSQVLPCKQMALLVNVNHLPLLVKVIHYYVILNAANNQCEDGTHNCAEFCINDGTSFRCACSFGFALASNGRDCIGEHYKHTPPSA